MRGESVPFCLDVDHMVKRRLLNKIRAVSLALVTVAARLSAQSGSAELGGYVKYLFDRSESPTQPVSYDQLLHARLNTKWYPTQDLSGILEIRTRVFYGDIIENTPGFSSQLGHDAGFGKLGWLVWNQKKSVAYAELDRLYLNWGASQWQVTAGRQRIAWGTNLVWNPIDLFNPLSVLDFDYEERPAVDAVRIQYYTGEVSKVELAIKPGTASSEAIDAAQWSTNKWSYDFHLLGGVRARDWFAGGGWAGDIMGGGFRGEILTAKIPMQLRSGGSSATLVSSAVSGDYTFPNSFYIHTEVLYNSEGVVANAALARQRAQALALLSPSRWSVYQEFACNVSPLLRADVFAIFNPDDGSSVFVPTATWSVATDLDLTLLALIFRGSSGTLYGQAGTTAYVRAKWSF